MPSFMLKKIVLGNFSSGPVDPMMADAIDFMVDRVRIMTLGRGHLSWEFSCLLGSQEIPVSLSVC